MCCTGRSEFDHGWGLFWLVVLRINVVPAIFQPYRDFEAGDYQSLKSLRRDRESNTGSLAPPGKRLTTIPALLQGCGLD